MKRALTALALAAGACTTADVPAPAPEPVTAPPSPPTDPMPPAIAPATTATRPPVVATTAAPPAPVPARTAGAGAAEAAGDDVWARLAACESGTRNLRNPPYSGYWQFTGRTWRSLGYEGEAADYPYEVQLEAAKRLLARSGPGQWPVCGRRVGLGRVA